MRFTVCMGSLRARIALAVVATTAAWGLGGTSASAAAASPPSCAKPATGPDCIIDLGTQPLGDPGHYASFKFRVPKGVVNVEAHFPKGESRKIGLGLFDPRGTAFQSPGFRGVAGEERKSVWVGTSTATPGFIPGPIQPGVWTVVVPNFLAFFDVQVYVTLSYGTPVAAPALQPVPEMVRNVPGWYKGDLHVHTNVSSDADSSGKALTPAAMAARAKALGLDFINLSDHNVTTQNNRLRDASPPGFLLLGGEEVTAWTAGPGHMTAAGLKSGAWLDWRFRPRYGRYAATATWTADERPVQDAIAAGHAAGAYLSANHPYVAPGFGSDWGFFDDSDVDAAALPDGMEVWNDNFWLSFNFLTLARWDQELIRGRHLCGNGGSDVHGVGGKTEVGTPTTVVYAPSLSRSAIVDAMKRCRMYVTKNPNGPSLKLTAATSQGEAMMGSTITGPAGSSVPMSARVEGGDGRYVAFIQNGNMLYVDRVNGNNATITHTFRIGQGAVRLQLHQEPWDLQPRALSNPIFLRTGTSRVTW